MSETQTTQYKYEEDTISLIDLVAVLVRHRRLIIVSTMLAGLLAIAVLFIGPTVGFGTSPQTAYTAEQRIFVNSIPADLERYVTFDPVATLRAVLSDPSIVGEVYAPLEEDPPENRTRERYLTMIRRDVINDLYTVGWNSNTRILTVRFIADTPERAVAFLEAMIARIEPEIMRQVELQLTDNAEAFNVALEETYATIARVTEQAAQRRSGNDGGLTAEDVLTVLDDTSGAALAALTNMIFAERQLVRMFDDARAIYVPVGGAVVFEDEDDTSTAMIVVVTTVIVFFLTVFLAFVLEYVRRVRTEPEEMAKLTSAWHRE